MYVLVRAGLYPGLSVYCLLLTASPVLQSIRSGVREIFFCTSVLVEQSVCVHPLFVLYCIVYYKSVYRHGISPSVCLPRPRGAAAASALAVCPEAPGSIPREGAWVMRWGPCAKRLAADTRRGAGVVCALVLPYTIVAELGWTD